MARRTSWAVGVWMVVAAFAGGFAAQLLVGGQAAHAQDGAPAELRTGRLVIVDAAGTERASLGLGAEDDQGVGLILNDPEGRLRLLVGESQLLGQPEDVSWTVAFLDAGGTDRLAWGVQDDGTACGGHITDADGVLRLGVGAADYGTGITLNDEKGQSRLGMGVGPGGGGDFVAKDQFGNDVWRALGDVGPRPLP